MYMGAYPLFGMALWAVISVVPFWKLLKRTGHSQWWSFLAAFPPFAIIMLWVLAFKGWPSEDG